MKRNYYLVEVMCGHVGRNCYIPILFPIHAESASKAAEFARIIPRVKHDNKYAILNVIEVTKERYETQIQLNNDDEYLNWKMKGGDVDYSQIMNRIVFMGREYDPSVETKREEKLQNKAKKSTTEMLRLKEIKNIELHINDYINFLDVDIEIEVNPDQDYNYQEHICKNFGSSWLSQPVLQF